MQRLLGVPVPVLRLAARLLLVALTVTTVGPALHGVHDTDCDPVVVLHDESQHHFAAAPQAADHPAGGDHCVACHFLRTSRGPGSWEPSGLQILTSGNLLHDSDGRLDASRSVSPQPARAPPQA